MNAPVFAQPHFPSIADTDSTLADFCVEAANAMQAVTDMLGAQEEGGAYEVSLANLASLLRTIQSPLDAASNELHRRALRSDETARQKPTAPAPHQPVTGAA